MKRGGNAYRLFEFLKERSEHASAGVKEPPAKPVEPAVGKKPEPGKPRPTLLLGGIEGKLAEKKPAPVEPPADADRQTADAARLARGRAFRQYRGKAFVMKYDVALVVALALIGLLVISWVWGYAAGKGMGMRIAREQYDRDRNTYPPGGGNAEDSTPAASSPITDDGTGDYRIKLMSMGRHTSENRRYFEKHYQTLIDEGYPNVLLDRSSSHIALYAGRFKTKEAGEKYLGHFRAKDGEYDECYVPKRP